MFPDLKPLIQHNDLLRELHNTSKDNIMTEQKQIPEALENVVDEYLHWRKVNPHIKGGENYLKRLQEAIENASTDRVSRPKCDHCGTETIDRCWRCGAPQCCPKCCVETTQEALEQGTVQPVAISQAVMDFAKQVAEAAALCESSFDDMHSKRDENANFGQSKEYHAAYQVYNNAVNARFDLLRDNCKKLEEIAIALVSIPERESRGDK